jgi:hypothetical protein
MLLLVMRIRIDLPDPLFRRIKALAAMRGATMKGLIIQALEREVNAGAPIERNASTPSASVPLIRLRSGCKLDLSKFDFDDLLT